MAIDRIHVTRGDPAPRGVFVGLATLDVVNRVSAPPSVNQKITATSQSVAAGGPAANAAVAFAALGGRATLITALGADAVAGLIREDLARHGVTVVDVGTEEPTQSTISSVMVLEGTGERSVVSVDGSGTAARVPVDLADHLAGVDVVLVDGHHPKLAVAANKAAQGAGIRTVVDAGRWKPVMADVIEIGAEMVCSGDFRVPGARDSEESAAALIDSGITTVVTTHGGSPIRWWSGGERGTVEVPAITAVDTLGAGDVFHGAYAYYSACSGDTSTEPETASGRDPAALQRDLQRSARVASLKSSLVGPRAWIAHLAELDEE